MVKTLEEKRKCPYFNYHFLLDKKKFMLSLNDSMWDDEDEKELEEARKKARARK